MNRKLIVLDDEVGVLDAYRVILDPAPPQMAITSSRGSAAKAVSAPEAQEEAFEVDYVTTGPEALIAIEKALKEGKPYVGGFFDVKLGGEMDGIEAIRRVKDLDPNFLVVMVTAYQDRSVDEIASIFGKDYADRWDFVAKPFSRNEILQKARNLIANWDRKKKEKLYVEKIKQQQRQLIQSESLAAIGNLARGIGHEFGNILLGIMGNAELACQKGTPESMEKALKIISHSAERAGVITRNLQTLVRTETARELSDIRDTIRECLLLLEHERKKASIVVEEKFQDSLPFVLISRAEMGQVFLNLAINAIHAMKETGGGNLTISAASKDDGVEVLVQDTGCGIPPENLNKIFLTLFTTKGQNGSGIGLSVSKKIVQNHKGKITAESEVGKGTCFRVWLPKGQPTQA